MHMLLLLAGLVAALAGVAALAYGLVSPTFRSDAVLVTGVLGLGGGLILIGLGAVVGQLRRIADALEVQPMGRGLVSMPEPRAPEVAAAGANAVAAALALEPEPPPAPPPMSPAPVVPPPPEPPAEPMRPAPSVRGPMEPLRAPAMEPTRAADRLSAPVVPPQPAAPPPTPTPTPLAAEWPHVDISDRVAPPPPPASSRDAPPRAVAEPPLSSKPAPVVVLERSGPSVPPAEVPAGDKPRVLKSGVIEGMAYTLYSDGSVDAELPSGTTHFPSIAAWRAHLREGA